MKKNLSVLSGVVLGFAPMVALAACTAAGTGGTNTVNNLLCTALNLLNSVVPVIIALGVVYFVWGVVTYVISSDEEAKKAGRDRIIFGIIGLAVIVALWGLVGILLNTFGSPGNSSTFTLPTVTGIS